MSSWKSSPLKFMLEKNYFESLEDSEETSFPINKCALSISPCNSLVATVASMSSMKRFWLVRLRTEDQLISARHQPRSWYLLRFNTNSSVVMWGLDWFFFGLRGLDGTAKNMWLGWTFKTGVALQRANERPQNGRVFEVAIRLQKQLEWWISVSVCHFH